MRRPGSSCGLVRDHLGYGSLLLGSPLRFGGTRKLSDDDSRSKFGFSDWAEHQTREFHAVRDHHAGSYRIITVSPPPCSTRRGRGLVSDGMGPRSASLAGLSTRRENSTPTGIIVRVRVELSGSFKIRLLEGRGLVGPGAALCICGVPGLRGCS